MMIPAGFLATLDELYRQNPTAFDYLIRALDEDRRPNFGSVTLVFVESELRQVEMRETVR